MARVDVINNYNISHNMILQSVESPTLWQLPPGYVHISPGEGDIPPDPLAIYIQPCEVTRQLTPLPLNSKTIVYPPPFCENFQMKPCHPRIWFKYIDSMKFQVTITFGQIQTTKGVVINIKMCYIIMFMELLTGAPSTAKSFFVWPQAVESADLLR